MKKTKLLFWLATGFIFLFEGVMPAVFFGSEMSKEGVRHLGYPEYFGTTLVVFKILGALALVLPQVPARIKEAAYLGFVFNFFFAFVSHWAVDGLGGQTVFPLVIMAILGASYFYWKKMEAEKALANG